MGSDEEAQFSPAKRFRRIWHQIRSQRRPILVLGSALVLVSTFIFFVGLWSFRHFQCYTREAGVSWQPASITNIPRPCPHVEYSTTVASTYPPQRICLTTLTDRQSTSQWQRLLRCRNFDGVADLTMPNLQAYAHRHGYTFRDASPDIDSSRPPAWSKIKAVQYLLQQQQEEEEGKEQSPSCDWVFWIDADIVVMNASIAITSFLPHASTGIDLLVTMDRRLTANSGAWLIRNTPWSKQFLDTWWNMRTYVRQPGLSLSGDNAAFGELIQSHLAKKESRVAMVPRCTFNSFAVFGQQGSEIKEQDQEWYLSENFYHQGDFMAHASGVDQKEACVAMLLEKAS